MFNLDQAIQEWCIAIDKRLSTDNNRMDELKDHLYCIIEHYQTQGLSEQQAFNKAQDSFGDQETLSQEYAKNKNWKEALCSILNQKIGHEDIGEVSMENMKKKLSAAMISNSIIWAAAMIGSAIIIDDKDAQQNISMMLIVLWFCSYMMIQRLQTAAGDNLATACSEWKMLKSKLRSIGTSD